MPAPVMILRLSGWSFHLVFEPINIDHKGELDLSMSGQYDPAWNILIKSDNEKYDNSSDEYEYYLQDASAYVKDLPFILRKANKEAFTNDSVVVGRFATLDDAKLAAAIECRF